MRKLSDIKGPEAIDVLAVIMESVVDLKKDTAIAEAWRQKDKLGCLSQILTFHKPEIGRIMEALNGGTDYSIADFPALFLNTVNDPAFSTVFPSAETEEESSGSATVITMAAAAQ